MTGKNIAYRKEKGWHSHRMCGECWIEQQDPDDFRVPAQVRGIAESVCCFCGGKTRLGIYVRHETARLTCTCEID